MQYQCNLEDVPTFFILGRPRSGTTMLRSMLDAHPMVLVPPEFPILSCFRHFSIHFWNEKDIDRFVSKVSKRYKFASMQVSAEVLKNNIIEVYRQKGTMNLKLALNVLALSYQSPFEKHEILQIGDKNPRYSMHVSKLRQLFPDARFIFIFRHVLSVLESMQKVNFEWRWPAFIAWRWKRMVLDATKDQKRCAEKTFFVLYEKLIKERTHYLQEICSFLNIPYHLSMLNFNEEKKLYRVFGDELYNVHSSLLKSPDNVILKEWKGHLSLKQKIAVRWAGKSIEKAGYEGIKKPHFGYYLLGVPSVVTALSLLWVGRILNIVSFGHYSVHINSILAQIFYKNKKRKDG